MTSSVEYYSPTPTILFFTNLIISRSNNDNSYKTKILPLFITHLLPFKNHDDCLDSLTTFNFEDFYVNSLPGVADYFIKFNNYLLNILSTHDMPPSVDKEKIPNVTGKKSLPTTHLKIRESSVTVVDNSYTPPPKGSKLEKFQSWKDSGSAKLVGENSTNDSPKTSSLIEKPGDSIEKIEFDRVSKTHIELHNYISGDDESIPDSLIHSIHTYFQDIEKNITYDIDLLFKAYIYLICQDCVNFRSPFNEKLSLKNKDQYFRFVKFWVLSSLISQL